jgi:protein-S-isoprenylcysteine O-methyltransferase Ste14
MTTPKDHPGVIAPPPLIFLGFLLGGWGLGHLVGEPDLGLSDPWRRGLALSGIVVGIVIEGWAAGLFRRARTAIQPWKPSTALIRSGLYRFSRNPIYVGFGITYLGLSVGLNSPMALALVVPCLFVVDRYVIQREERYLEARFGADYLDYKMSVRRWL